MGGHVINSSQWHLWRSYCYHFQESITKGSGSTVMCSWPFVPSCFSPLQDVNLTPSHAAAILEHEVTSLSMTTWPGTADWKNGKILVSLSAPEFTDEWDKQFSYLFSHCSSDIVLLATQSIANWCHHFWIHTIKSLFLLISKWELLCFNFNLFLLLLLKDLLWEFNFDNVNALFVSMPQTWVSTSVQKMMQPKIKVNLTHRAGRIRSLGFKVLNSWPFYSGTNVSKATVPEKRQECFPI